MSAVMLEGAKTQPTPALSIPG